MNYPHTMYTVQLLVIITSPWRSDRAVCASAPLLIRGHYGVADEPGPEVPSLEGQGMVRLRICGMSHQQGSGIAPQLPRISDRQQTGGQFQLLGSGGHPLTARGAAPPQMVQWEPANRSGHLCLWNQ